MPVPDIEFETMLVRARGLRRRLKELGRVTDSVIVANVEARLQRKPQPLELPPGQSKLADEIVQLLDNPRLSTWQAHRLRRAFRVD